MHITLAIVGHVTHVCYIIIRHGRQQAQRPLTPSQRRIIGYLSYPTLLPAASSVEGYKYCFIVLKTYFKFAFPNSLTA